MTFAAFALPVSTLALTTMASLLLAIAVSLQQCRCSTSTLTANTVALWFLRISFLNGVGLIVKVWSVDGHG